MNCETSLTRLHYSKVVADTLRYVIVDRSAEDALQFWSQEPGDVRWYRFEPAAEEREAALSLLQSGGSQASGWPLLIPRPAIRTKIKHGCTDRQMALGRAVLQDPLARGQSL